MSAITSAVKQKQFRNLKFSVLSQNRSMPQFGRKFYHFVMGLLCFTLYAFALTRREALLLLASIGGVWIAGDLARLKLPKFNHFVLSLFGKVMRREELKSISGNSFYILGLTTVVLLCPKSVVLFAVLFLAVGDPSAAIVGTLYGRRRLFGKKSLEGSLACFVFSGLAAFLLAHFYFQLPVSQALWVAGMGGVSSSFAEMVPLPLDDNFNIPVISAGLMWLFLLAFPLISL